MAAPFWARCDAIPAPDKRAALMLQLLETVALLDAVYVKQSGFSLGCES